MACAGVYSREENTKSSAKKSSAKENTSENVVGSLSAALTQILVFYLAKALEMDNVAPVTFVKVRHKGNRC